MFRDLNGSQSSLGNTGNPKISLRYLKQYPSSHSPLSLQLQICVGPVTGKLQQNPKHLHVYPTATK